MRFTALAALATVSSLALLPIHADALAAPAHAHSQQAAAMERVGSSTIEPPPASGAAPFPTCPAYGIIGSRGSGENDPSKKDKWGEGLGPPDDNFAIDFGNLVPGVEYTYDPAPGYAAAQAPGLKSINTILFHRYRGSVAGGQDQLDGMVKAQRTKCGTKTKLILAGYSQGAQVSGNSYMDLQGTPAGQIIFGMVLFADPRYNHLDPSDFRTDQQIANQRALNHNGSLSILGLYYMGHARNFPTSSIGHILSYCLINDYVCQGVGGNLESHQHSAYGDSTYPADAADWFAAQTATVAPWPSASVTCGISSPPQIDVTYNQRRALVIVGSLASPSRSWAVATGAVHWQYWQVNSDTICKLITGTGTFTVPTTVPSPAGDGTVAAGTTGTARESYAELMHGTLVTPTDHPSHGFLGTTDFACTVLADGKGTCAGTPSVFNPDIWFTSPGSGYLRDEATDARYQSRSGQVFWVSTNSVLGNITH